MTVSPADRREAPVPIVRPAVPADAPRLARILQEWLDATDWMPDLHTLSETEGFVGGLIAGECLVAGDGFLALDGDTVVALYVAEGARGQGLGAALIEVAKARRDRLTLWTFQANAGARRFYARHGFVEGRTTEDGNEEGLPDVELTWERA